jgi:hypothetical protein
MKNSKVILGIAFVSLFNLSIAANSTDNLKPLYNNILAFYNENGHFCNKSKFDKPTLNTENEYFDPETIINYNSKTIKEIIAERNEIIDNTSIDETEFMNYEQSMKEIIAQSDLIIENTISNQTYSLNSERTIEDEITELELIIDSNVSNEFKLLKSKVY